MSRSALEGSLFGVLEGLGTLGRHLGGIRGSYVVLGGLLGSILGPLGAI